MKYMEQHFSFNSYGYAINILIIAKHNALVGESERSVQSYWIL